MRTDFDRPDSSPAEPTEGRERVYLSRKPTSLGWRAYGDDFIELGPPKGNRGDQNYPVPANIDLTSFKSAVVWCVRFKVGFGVAPLTA